MTNIPHCIRPVGGLHCQTPEPGLGQAGLPAGRGTDQEQHQVDGGQRDEGHRLAQPERTECVIAKM